MRYAAAERLWLFSRAVRASSFFFLYYMYYITLPLLDAAAAAFDAICRHDAIRLINMIDYLSISH